MQRGRANSAPRRNSVEIASEERRRQSHFGLSSIVVSITALTIGLLPLVFGHRQHDGVAFTGGENLRGGARQQESDRGRGAGTPSEIPARGWRDILFRVYQNISTHRVVLVAAGITFYSILALFPAIAALVAVYGLFADPGHDSRASRPAVWVRARGSD